MPVLRIVPSVVLSIGLAGCAAKADKVNSIEPAQAPESSPSASIMPASDVAPQASSPDGNSPVLLSAQLQDFAQAIAQERSIPLSHAQQLLSEANFISRVAQLTAPPKQKIVKSWSTYRQRFVEPIRIRQGLAFWQRKQATLDSVATEYGVPASILVAIIGVETLYGQHMGNFRVLDSLYTLGFHFPDANRPDRAEFFRGQLADLIQLDHEGRLDARQVEGSYAGALGIPQFLPGSMMRYASDGDNDGKVDLLGSEDDAIASVASFLRQHGWEPSLPVFAPVRLPGNAASLVDGGLKPSLQWQQLQDAGASVTAENRNLAWQAHALGVIDLPEQSQGTADYRVATPNFFALTEYNRSYFYATAVTDLAQALASQMGYSSPNY